MNRQPHLLLVDDEPLVLDSLRRSLRRHTEQWQMTYCSDPADALAVAFAAPVDVVITDISMPGLSGFELMRRLRENPATAQVPVIVLTGGQEHNLKQRALESGAADLLNKPADTAELLARIRNVLALKQYQDELAAQNERLHELNEAKNRLLGIAAHDLRNPISVIRLGLDMLLQTDFEVIEQTRVRVLRRMDQQCEKMLTLINDLLDVAAIQAGRVELELELIDPAELLANCLDAARLLAGGKQIDLALQMADDLPPIWVDPDRIQQVIDNLISNAIKYSHPRTTTTVVAARVGDELRLDIIDQGQGIPAGELASLFTEFGRTSVKPTGGENSVGLGLAITRRMVEAHGGRVEVTSEVGSGSTFTVLLPFAPEGLTGTI